MANIVNIFVLNEIENIIQRHENRMFLRSLRDESDPFNFTDKMFIKHFRLSKDSVRYLFNELVPHIRQPQRSTGLTPEQKIMTVLHFYGHGSYQHAVGFNYGMPMSQPSVSRSIIQVTTAINEILLPTIIKFPTDDISINANKIRFFEKYGVNGIIGAIDCTHIAIIAPPAEDPDYPGRVYYCRKGYPSINTQIICDCDLNIININARYPGSTHDAAIWQTSSIKRHLETAFINGRFNDTFLLGDSGYPLEPWLMTPVDGAANGSPEALYNEFHTSARNSIERLNGVLKSRFRALLKHRTLNYHPIQAGMIINACAVLHNIALNFNVEIPEDDDNLPADVDQIQIPIHDGNANIYDGQRHAEGVRVRNNIIRIVNEINN